MKNENAEFLKTVGKDWICQSNPWGWWIVGPEVDGLISVRGAGDSLDEAVEMARRSYEPKS